MRRYYFLIIVALFVSTSHALNLQTFYGEYEISEPIIAELLQTDAVQRLKHIQQYGVNQYVRPTRKPYSRYEHSVGVMVLLRNFGASLQEQIAGLLHDVSHTVFSHVGDHVAALQRAKRVDQNDEAYQDTMHSWYIAQTDVREVLDRYGISVEEINHKNGQYQMLEQDLPDLCADRIEYNLYGGYIEGLVTQEEVQMILSALRYENGRWFFDDAPRAKKLASISLWLTEHCFAASWNFVNYEFAAKALSRAVDLGLLTMHDIHFSVDDLVWKLLHSSSDDRIQSYLRTLVNYKDAYEEVAEGSHDASFARKFRGVNPWVLVSNTFKRLSECDDAFRTKYERLRASFIKPRYIRYR